jgi:hypothetical protein
MTVLVIHQVANTIFSTWADLRFLEQPFESSASATKFIITVVVVLGATAVLARAYRQAITYSSLLSCHCDHQHKQARKPVPLGGKQTSVFSSFPCSLNYRQWTTDRRAGSSCYLRCESGFPKARRIPPQEHNMRATFGLESSGNWKSE